MTNNLYVKSSKAAWRPSISFWVTAAIWLLLLIIAIPTGGFGGWLLTFILFLILTALYALIFGRRSWLGLPSRKGAGGTVGGGVVALIAAAMILGPTAPQAGTGATLADVQQPASAAATPSAKPTPSPTAARTAKPTAKPSVTPAATPSPTTSPSERLILLGACLENGASEQQGTETVVCTLDEAGVLVWMSEKESKAMLRARTEAKIAAEVKSVADKAEAADLARVAAEQAAVVETERVAAQKVADDAAWAAAQQAEAERAVAQQVADDAAWVAAQQAEAERVVAQQAADDAAWAAAQQAPPIQQFVEAPASAYYQNCAAARAAGAAPLYAGQAGYRGALDRDKDGVACE